MHSAMRRTTPVRIVSEKYQSRAGTDRLTMLGIDLWI